jgi:putative spermidine/putrescine transport system permease protein
MEKWQDPMIAVVSVVLIAFALTLFFAIKLILRSAPGVEALLGSKERKGRN